KRGFKPHEFRMQRTLINIIASSVLQGGAVHHSSRAAVEDPGKVTGKAPPGLQQLLLPELAFQAVGKQRFGGMVTEIIIQSPACTFPVEKKRIVDGGAVGYYGVVCEGVCERIKT